MAQSYTTYDNNETTKRSFGLFETPFIRHLDGLKSSHRETYSLIDALCKNADGYCFAHNQELAEMLGIGERTVRRYLYKLESLGLITIEIQFLYKRKIWTYEALLKQNLYFENSGLAEISQEKFPLDRNDLPPMDKNVLPPPKQEIPSILETKQDLKKSFPRTDLTRGDGQKCPTYINTVASNVYKDSSSSLACSSNTRRPDFFLNDKDKAQEQAQEQAVENEIEEDDVVEAKELFGKFVRVSRAKYRRMCSERTKSVVDRYIEKANRQFDRWEDKGKRCEDHASLIEKWMKEDLGKADGNRATQEQMVEFRNTQAQAEQRKAETEQMIESFFRENEVSRDQYFWQKHASRLILFYPKNEKYSDENFQYGPDTMKRLNQWLNRVKEIKANE